MPDLSTAERTLGATGASPVLTPVDAVIMDEALVFNKRTGIKIDLDLACAAVLVRLHEEWLRRLIRHYLKNAQKHTVAGRKPHIAVRTRSDGAQVTVYVEDNRSGAR